MIRKNIRKDSDTQGGAGRSAANYPAESRALRCLFVRAPNSLYADTQYYGAQSTQFRSYALAANISMDEQFDLQLCDTWLDSLQNIKGIDVALFSDINPETEEVSTP